MNAAMHKIKALELQNGLLYFSSVDQEQQLIAACRRGDADAWDQLFTTFYPVAGKFIFQLSPHLSAEDVEEISQDVFLSVIRNIQTFHGNCAFQTWLYRIATNKTRDFIEKQRAAKREYRRSLRLRHRKYQLLCEYIPSDWNRGRV